MSTHNTWRKTLEDGRTLFVVYVPKTAVLHVFLGEVTYVSFAEPSGGGVLFGRDKLSNQPAEVVFMPMIPYNGAMRPWEKTVSMWKSRAGEFLGVDPEDVACGMLNVVEAC
jgi:hypothetical protein